MGCGYARANRRFFDHRAPRTPACRSPHAMLGGIFVGAYVVKILLLIVVGFVVWALIRNYQRSLNKPTTRSGERAVENMVKCAHCGVNLPRSEAIYSGGDFFCTPEHKQLGKK